jgi:phospholipase C
VSPKATVRLIAAAALLAAACGHGTAGALPSIPAPGAIPRSHDSHVVTIVMENKEYGAVVGASGAPYTNRLARRYGLATRAFGIRHPSLPNYLALTSGSTHGIDSNCTDCHVAAPSIAGQLEAAQLSWKAYLEDLPQPCFTGASAGAYAKKHNPFAYYDDVTQTASRCRRMVPLAQLANDLRSGRLPTYAFIVPNLCSDTHDCPVSTGDRFLAHVVPTVLAGLGPHGFLVVSYDEGTTDAGCCGASAGGHIPLIVAGPDVRRGARQTRPVDLYGVLRTTEAALRLPALGEAADPRHGDLRALFARPPRVR